MPTITAQGNHLAEVRAFLIKYYGESHDDPALRAPLHTVTSKARFGLVMVHGEPYAIADIGMRMLVPRELARATSFPDSYRIAAPTSLALPGLEEMAALLTLEAQVRMIGNAVPPVMAEALVAANLGERRAATTEVA
jgi:DNA (cytosine-5)-methyltransferase 1